MRPLIGIVHAFVTPGIFVAESISATRRSYVMPGRHCAFGLSVIVVSNMSRPGGIGCRLRAPGLAPHVVDFGERLEDRVLLSQHLPRARDGNPRQRRRHEENRSFLERRHELAADPRPRNPRENERHDAGHDHRPAVREHEVDHRTIDADQGAVDRIRALAVDLSAHEESHRHRHERQRQQARRRHRKGLREGERLEEPAFLAFEREDGKERDGDDEQRDEERRPDFLRALGDDAPALLGGQARRS